jgi:hypothetical protein
MKDFPPHNFSNDFVLGNKSDDRIGWSSPTWEKIAIREGVDRITGRLITNAKIPMNSWGRAWCLHGSTGVS